MNNYKLFELEQIAIQNNKKLIKLQRLIYILQNNIKLYRGKNGGLYYKSGKSKVYI